MSTMITLDEDELRVLHQALVHTNHRAPMWEPARVASLCAALAYARETYHEPIAVRVDGSEG